MPKAARQAHTRYTRSNPYQPVITAASLAPAPTMATGGAGALSPIHSGGDRPNTHPWPPENDEKLMRARREGLNWGPIATRYFPDKSANACRKRHERLMEKRTNNEDWTTQKIEAMAKAYWDLRQQMWSVLADQLGEKWETVEIKCMEKGLKNLRTLGKPSQRHPFPVEDMDEHSEGRYQQSREYSRPRQEEGDNASNDNVLGHDGEHHFFNSQQNQQQRSYPSSNHPEQPSFAGGSITPPYTSRSYSLCSSSGPSSGLANTSPYSTIQHPSPLQQPQQQLPSFSSTFGQTSVPAIQPPAPPAYRQSPYIPITTN